MSYRNSNSSRYRVRTEAVAFSLAAIVLLGVTLGTLTSCGDADLLIPGGGFVRPTFLPDETPEATETPDR